MHPQEVLVAAHKQFDNEHFVAAAAKGGRVHRDGLDRGLAGILRPAYRYAGRSRRTADAESRPALYPYHLQIPLILRSQNHYIIVYPM